MVSFYVNMPIMLKHQQFKPKTNASLKTNIVAVRPLQKLSGSIRQFWMVLMWPSQE